MKFKRVQALWQETAGHDGSGEDPSEARFRTWVLAIAMLAGPPLILSLYYKTVFTGLLNHGALDFAQLGRNLSAGHGFITYVLRPLALTHGNNPLAQPDVTHGPLYPFLLALAFGLRGANDQTVAMVSGLFYLLTIPVLYVLAARAFNRGVALLSVLIFTANALLLEYAVCGLHITLYVFLMTCLLLSIYNIAHSGANSDENGTNRPVPTGPYAAAGILTALLYLTDPIFIWITPVILVTVYTITLQQKGRKLVACAAPMLLLILPWMVRNAALTANPIFGLRGMELWMYTKGLYPGDSAYRMTPGDLTASAGLFQAIAHKILLGAGLVIQQFPQVTASWILAFFLPCLLFRFTNGAANVLRCVMIWCLAGLLAGSLAFQIWMPLFVAVIPVMIVFSVGFLLHLMQQAQLRGGSFVMAVSLVAIAAIYPLLSDVALRDKMSPPDGIGAAANLARSAQKSDVTLSDQPAIIAWYGERPSMMIPVDDTKIADLKTRFQGLRWLFLTRGVRTNSPAWAAVYDGLAQWNADYDRARQSKSPIDRLVINARGAPLLDALYGYTSVPPADGSDSSVVVAMAPASEPQVGLVPRAGKPFGP